MAEVATRMVDYITVHVLVYLVSKIFTSVLDLKMTQIIKLFKLRMTITFCMKMVNV